MVKKKKLNTYYVVYRNLHKTVLAECFGVGCTTFQAKRLTTKNISEWNVRIEKELREKVIITFIKKLDD